MIGHLAGEGRVEADGGVGVDEAQAVGPDELDVVLAADVPQAPLAGEALGPGLAEAGGDDDDALDVLGGALLDGLVHDVGGKDDDGQVDRAGDVDHVAIGGDGADAALARCDGVQHAGETAGEDVAEDVVGDGAGRGRHAEDGDAAGAEKGFQRVRRARLRR